MRATRGFRYSVIRLIAPPLPAASRPSKTTTMRAARRRGPTPGASRARPGGAAVPRRTSCAAIADPTSSRSATLVGARRGETVPVEHPTPALSGYDVIGDVHGHVGGTWSACSPGWATSSRAARAGLPQVGRRCSSATSIDRGPGQVGDVGTGAGDGRRRHGADGAGQPRVQRDRLRHADADGGLVPATQQEELPTARHVPRPLSETARRRTGRGSTGSGRLPLWLDLGGIRVVHACWDPASMAVLGDGTLTDRMVAAPKGSAEYEAIEVVLKGPEIHMGGAVVLRQGRVRPAQGPLQMVERPTRPPCGCRRGDPLGRLADTDGKAPFAPLSAQRGDRGVAAGGRPKFRCSTATTGARASPPSILAACPLASTGAWPKAGRWSPTGGPASGCSTAPTSWRSRPIDGRTTQGTAAP